MKRRRTVFERLDAAFRQLNYDGGITLFDVLRWEVVIGKMGKKDYEERKKKGI